MSAPRVRGGRTLLGTVMGTSVSLRTMVRMGSILSTTPVSTLAPDAVAICTRSPTRKGCEMNCGTAAAAPQSPRRMNEALTLHTKISTEIPYGRNLFDPS